MVALSKSIGSINSGDDRVKMRRRADLRGSETSEGKHANLAGDERPVLVGVDFLQVISQNLSHSLQHTACMGSDIVLTNRVVVEMP